MKCSVFIATSLDGFIAREDGRIDWLDQANQSVPPGKDCGYGEFMSTVDALVMGRKSFETVLTFPEWPYGDLPVFVLTSTMSEVPEGAPASVQMLDGEPAIVVEALTDAGYEHLYIDGGATIHGFLMEGLINEITITTVPILIGNGRRLFAEFEGELPVQLISSVAYDFGFVQSRYLVG